MTAEQFFAGLAIACFTLLGLLWCELPRKRKHVIRPTAPASRWPPYSEP